MSLIKDLKKWISLYFTCLRLWSDSVEKPPKEHLGGLLMLMLCLSLRWREAAYAI